MLGFEELFKSFRVSLSFGASSIFKGEKDMLGFEGLFKNIRVFYSLAQRHVLPSFYHN
jgi:hypothetical protein